MFGVLAPDQIKQLRSFACIRCIASGTTLFVKGDPSTELFVVVSGTVKITLSSSDGREAISGLLHAGEIFGEIALLDGQPRTADAVAATDCELMVIKRRDFLGFVHSESKFAMKLIALLWARLRFAVVQMEEAASLDLPTRLARLLVQLLETNAAADKKTIAITQQEISEMLGKSRESVNKHLQIWAKHKVIALKRGAIVVLAARALRALVSGDRFGVLFGLRHAGEIFGEIALLDGQPCTAKAVVAVACELIVINRRDYRDFVHNEPKVAMKLIAHLCARLRTAVARMEEAVSLDLPTRLARLLVQLLERNAAADKKTIAITQQNIGEMLGASRESINKHLQIWAKRKVIGLKRGAIVVLAPQALRALCEWRS